MKVKLPRYLTEVTTLSKYLALFLFIALPLIGFKLGMEYQRKLDESQSPESTAPTDLQAFITQPECESYPGMVCEFIADD